MKIKFYKGNETEIRVQGDEEIWNYWLLRSVFLILDLRYQNAMIFR